MSDGILVMGAGHQGLAMAAFLTWGGVRTNVWNRTYDHVKSIIARGGEITVRGVISGSVQISKISTDVGEVMEKVIMVTTPASAHRDIAVKLAPYVNENHIIVLNPGRTFGVLEFANVLRENGCKSLPIIAEAQTIIFTCRRSADNEVSIYALKKDVMLATLEQDEISEVISALPDCIRGFFKPAQSWIQTSMGNVGMILHCLPVCLNTGWIENNRSVFKYYYDGITPTVASVLEKLDIERMKAAEMLGCSVESTVQWMRRTYGIDGDSLYECLQNNIYYREIDAPQSLHHRYIEEDVPCGLVAVESVGRRYGFKTDIATLIIDLANLLMECDYRQVGRRIENYMNVDGVIYECGK